MTRKPPLSPEERALFQAHVKHIKPLPQNKLGKAQKPLSDQLGHLRRTNAEQEIQQKWKSEPITLNEQDLLTGEQSLAYFTQGLARRQIRELQQGHMRIEDRIDLHKLRLLDADQLISEFLAHCAHEQFRCVLMVHGKGLARLKTLLNQRLRASAQVLAFCSAKNKHGGTGAVYVLLRREA